MNLKGLDARTEALLMRYGFDESLFDTLRTQVKRGELSKQSNVVQGEIQPPSASEVTGLPAPGSSKYDAAHRRGLEALSRGQVAAAFLNGGMATRFGGVVKGIVEAVDGKSFLEWKLSELSAIGERTGADVPLLIMNSFATDQATRGFLGDLATHDASVSSPVFFSQFVSLRLDEKGEPFFDTNGALSPYAPGHGDFSVALRASGELARLRAAGVKLITLSNIDNLGARLDPAVLGMHIESGCSMTVEVVHRSPGDTGGAPATVGDRLMLVEGFRFPSGFDPGTISVFNTNSFVFDLDALDVDFPLTWFYVEKSVDGKRAIQLERLVGELSSFCPTQYLEVPRSGPRGRFFPIKTPDDLEATRPALREMLETSIV